MALAAWMVYLASYAFLAGNAQDLIVAIAAGLLLGLNLQHYHFCMTAFKEPTFEPAWIIPCQAAASLLALVLFFDLWEARRLRAQPAEPRRPA